MPSLYNIYYADAIGAYLRRRCADRGAAVSAAMVAPCASDVLCAAVLDRQPLTCGSGVGVIVGSCWQKCHRITRPLLLLRGSNRFALPPIARPTKFSGASRQCHHPTFWMRELGVRGEAKFARFFLDESFSRLMRCRPVRAHLR